MRRAAGVTRRPCLDETCYWIDYRTMAILRPFRLSEPSGYFTFTKYTPLARFLPSLDCPFQRTSFTPCVAFLEIVCTRRPATSKIRTSTRPAFAEEKRIAVCGLNGFGKFLSSLFAAGAAGVGSTPDN